MTAATLMTRALQWCLDPANATTINWRGGSYFTATDLYNRMRADLREQEYGSAYGTAGLSAGYGMGYKVPGGTLDDVRTFLLRKVAAGELTTEHPSGKRTTTLLRYRAAGAEKTTAEQERDDRRQAKQARGTVIHAPADATVPGYQTHPICQKPKTGAAKSTYYRSCRKKPTVYARNGAQPNCTHCLRKLVATA